MRGKRSKVIKILLCFVILLLSAIFIMYNACVHNVFTGKKFCSTFDMGGLCSGEACKKGIWIDADKDCMSYGID